MDWRSKINRHRRPTPTRVSRNGQIVLAAGTRRAAGIQPGHLVVTVPVAPGTLVVEKVKGRAGLGVLELDDAIARDAAELIARDRVTPATRCPDRRDRSSLRAAGRDRRSPPRTRNGLTGFPCLRLPMSAWRAERCSEASSTSSEAGGSGHAAPSTRAALGRVRGAPRYSSAR